MNPPETDSHTATSGDHHSGSLPHDSGPSTGRGTVPSSDEATAREGIGGVHAPHCHGTNLHHNEEDQA